MNVKEKIVYTFNKFYVDLIKDMKRLSPELKAKVKHIYKVVDKSSDEHIQFFCDGMSQYFQNLEPSNEAIQSVCIFKNVSVGDVLAHIGEKNVIMTWNYLYVLSALGMLFKLVGTEPDNEEANTLLFDKVVIAIGIIRGRGTAEAAAVLDDILDDDIRGVLSKIEKVEEVEEVGAGGAAAGGPEDDVMKMFAGFENSKICNLAKEISSEIDISNVKLDSQEDIMKLMDFSSSNNILGNIIGKVSSKMQEKMSKGEMKQEDLIGEAMNMMSMMGGAQGFFNNPMMADLMKNMKKGKVNPRTDVMRRESTREKLRKKLEERNSKQ
jgi:hypothetical protein